MSVNKVILVGRIGNLELKYTPSGSAVCVLSVATSETWTDKQTGKRQEKTEWHRVNVWGQKLAENCNKYLSKGSMVYLEGKIQTRSWEDKDGNKKYSTEILASTVNFLSTKASSNDQEDSGSSHSDDNGADSGYADDDIPF